MTPRKVEAWLQEDLLDEPARPGLGAGNGRGVDYTAELVEQAVEIGDLVRRHRSYDTVVVILFQRGHYVDNEARLRAAFTALLDRAREEVVTAADRALRKQRATAEESETPQAPDPTDDGELVEWAESVLTDRLKRDPRTRTLRSRIADQPEAELGAVAHGLAALLSGTTSPPTDFWDAFGVGLGLPSEFATNDLPLVSDVRLDRLRQVIAHARLDEFEHTRELATKLQDITNRIAEVQPALEATSQLETERSRALIMLLPFTLAEQMGADLDAVEQLFDLADSML